MSAIHVSFATTPQTFLKCAAIRSIVFMDEQQCSFEEEFDGLDDQAQHIIGEIEGQPIACARIRYLKDYAKLERIAVLKAHRGKCFGREIILFMIECCKHKKVSLATMNAQVYAQAFYEKLCFKAEGEIFLEAGIEHIKMSRALNQS